MGFQFDLKEESEDEWLTERGSSRAQVQCIERVSINLYRI